MMLIFVPVRHDPLRQMFGSAKLPVALLWRKLFGTTVRDAGMPTRSGLHVYAHCQRERPVGVIFLVIDSDASSSSGLTATSSFLA